MMTKEECIDFVSSYSPNMKVVLLSDQVRFNYEFFGKDGGDCPIIFSHYYQKFFITPQIRFAGNHIIATDYRGNHLTHISDFDVFFIEAEEGMSKIINRIADIYKQFKLIQVNIKKEKLENDFL